MASITFGGCKAKESWKLRLRFHIRSGGNYLVGLRLRLRLQFHGVHNACYRLRVCHSLRLDNHD